MATGYHYTECGLDYVFLLNGFEVMQTGHGQVTQVSEASELDRVIATAILNRGRFTEQEVRFIRGLLDMSRAEFAHASGSDIDMLECANSEIPVAVEETIRQLCADNLISRAARSGWSLTDESKSPACPRWALYFSKPANGPR